eukprot:1139018-Pelagomonas_calceolata.AAC.2
MTSSKYELLPQFKMLLTLSYSRGPKLVGYRQSQKEMPSRTQGLGNGHRRLQLFPALISVLMSRLSMGPGRRKQ